jgi:hypothetical protein
MICTNLQSLWFPWHISWDLFQSLKIEYVDAYGVFVGKSFQTLGLKPWANYKDIKVYPHLENDKNMFYQIIRYINLPNRDDFKDGNLF